MLFSTFLAAFLAAFLSTFLATLLATQGQAGLATLGWRIIVFLLSLLLDLLLLLNVLLFHRLLLIRERGVHFLFGRGTRIFWPVCRFGHLVTTFVFVVVEVPVEVGAPTSLETTGAKVIWLLAVFPLMLPDVLQPVFCDFAAWVGAMEDLALPVDLLHMPITLEFAFVLLGAVGTWVPLMVGVMAHRVLVQLTFVGK